MIRSSQTKAALADLIGKEQDDLGQLVTAMRQDYAVGLAERTFRSTVKQANVTVTPQDSASERADVLAERLQDLYWQKLGAMLEFVAYGRVAWERVWKYEPATNLNMVELAELPYEYTEMILTEDGEFGGVRLKPAGKRKDPIELPPIYSWWLALDPTPLNPHGQSRYVGAPQKVWQDRKENFRMLGIFLKRFVLGGGIAHIPMTIEDPQIPGKFIDGFEEFAKHYDTLLGGGVLCASNERIPGKDGQPGEYVYDLEKLETQVRDGRPLLDIISASDAWMLLSFGFPPKTVLEGDAVGSFALVSMQMLLLWSVADEIVAQIVEQFQHIVDDAAAMNASGQIDVNYVPLTERPDDIANELLKSWLTTPQLSPLVAAVDLEAIFDAVGVPVSPDALAKLQAIQAQLATIQAVAPASPPQGQLDTREPAAPLQLASPFLSRLWK